LSIKDINLNNKKGPTLLENNIPPEDRSLYRIDTYYVAIIEITHLGSENLHELITKFRAFSPDVLVQGMDASYVFGVNHLLRVLQLTVESWNRGIKLSKIMETDILMRLCRTSQISKAIKVGGLKNDSAACFILMSENLDSVLKIKQYIEGYYNEIHVSVLRIGKNKMARLRREFGITHKKMDRIFFENYLVEKAALVKF
jgi:tRNA threonylcarbamoyladenosine modification (KEOPS) complex Cgi121 subunit